MNEQVEELFPIDLPVGERFCLQRRRFSGGTATRRLSVVTGIHGDELEGQYVCYLLGEWLRAHPEALDGIIDIYPGLNSLGLDSITRAIPFYGVDLNRIFPGNPNDFLPAQIADGIVEAVRGSDIAIDIHSSNIFLREIPQVRISHALADTLVPLANKLNIDFVWVHDAVTVLESTFAHALNSLGTKTLVVEMGVGMRVTQSYGRQLLDGLLHLLADQGFLAITPPPVRTPIPSAVGEVSYINANTSGLFIPTLEHCQQIAIGDKIGEIVDPVHGGCKEDIVAPAAGILFTLRAYPIVYEGSLIARIFGETPCNA